MGRVISRAGQPASRRVAERVREMIRVRHIRAGELLPTYHELGRELDAAYATVKFGLDILEGEGLVRRVPSKGTFVTKDIVHAPCALQHIGVIYPSSRGSLLFNKYFLSKIIEGISSGSPPGGDMHIFSMRDDGLVGAAQLGEWVMDGVVLLEVDNDDYLREFASWGTPGVVVDYHPGDDVPLDSVACDNAAAAQRMVEHLAAFGHRRVAYVGPCARRPVCDPRNLEVTLLERNSSDVRERREASVRALQDQGMFAAEICAPTADSDAVVLAAEFVAQGMRQTDRPTALLTDGEYTTITLLKELQRGGIRVPEDVSVCAVAGAGGPGSLTSQSFAYCRFDFVGMGRTAAELLVDRCRRPQVDKPRARRIGFEFVEGNTTRRVKAIKGVKK
jgi:DNA-binding LacI/PurR family transcriptional regulator